MLNAKNFGIAGGIVHGLLMVVLTLLGIAGLGTGLLELIGGLFVGYTVTIMGVVIGLIYGFIVGFVIFYALAYFYNMAEAK